MNDPQQAKIVTRPEPPGRASGCWRILLERVHFGAHGRNGVIDVAALLLQESRDGAAEVLVRDVVRAERFHGNVPPGDLVLPLGPRLHAGEPGLDGMLDGLVARGGVRASARQREGGGGAGGGAEGGRAEGGGGVRT